MIANIEREITLNVKKRFPENTALDIRCRMAMRTVLFDFMEEDDFKLDSSEMAIELVDDVAMLALDMWPNMEMPFHFKGNPTLESHWQRAMTDVRNLYDC